MTKQELDCLRSLKDKGYAVIIIDPEELNGAPSNKVEDRLIEISWDIIKDLGD